MKLTRRNFVKLAGIASLVGLTGNLTGCKDVASDFQNLAVAEKIPPDDKAKVYFSKHIDAEHLIALYEKISAEIDGKVAIKLHTGEPKGPNILPRDMVKIFQAQIPNSAIIETNTLYGGGRSTTERHRKTLKINGWTFCHVDIIDANGTVSLPVKNCFHLPEVSMGAGLTDYNSLVVLTHFKGHPMGGFGGSLKNIAIGCASGKVGKLQIHGKNWETGEKFLERMVDSGKAVCDHFGRKIVYINVMQRLSVDCDCVGAGAAAPELPDLGILASTDILAVDKAAVDMVYNFPGPEKKSLIERIESRQGLYQLELMEKQKMGTSNYEIISID